MCSYIKNSYKYLLEMTIFKGFGLLKLCFEVGFKCLAQCAKLLDEAFSSIVSDCRNFPVCVILSIFIKINES